MSKRSKNQKAAPAAEPVPPVLPAPPPLPPAVFTPTYAGARFVGALGDGKTVGYYKDGFESEKQSEVAAWLKAKCQTAGVKGILFDRRANQVVSRVSETGTPVDV